MKKHFTAHLLIAAAALVCQKASALGFGRVNPDAVLGQTLAMTVPVHVEGGERFGADCVSAEVYFGESRLLPNVVRTAVERAGSDTEWLVRISTLEPITEPVVEIALSAGCERRFVRRFTAFADPPTLVAARGAAEAATGPGTFTPVQRATAASESADAATRGAATSGVARPARTSSGTGMASRPPPAARAPAADAADPPRRVAGNRPAPSADVGRARVPVPRTVPAATGGAPRLVLDSGFSRLKLDMEEPVIPAVAPGASAVAGGAPESDDPATRQLHALEQSIAAVRRESRANREQTARLQAELDQARSRADWMPWLLGVLVLALLALAFLLWRLRRRARQQSHSAWFTESQLGPQVGESPVVTLVAPTPVVAARSAVAAAPPDAPPSIAGELVADPPAPAPAGPEAITTQPLDRAALAGIMAPAESTPRELSVEELLDLEQQADFFIALGQEDAAVDLLMSHLRSAGGQSPLPYTKLLEIYRRQDDRGAYERTRTRFNRRFNVNAPDWETGPGAGRLLEDYPDTVARIEGVWLSPIDAMAVLEAMLFKRDEASELFDLPAYRDVLLLYSLARDLWQQDGGNAGTQVDVLLPLDDFDTPPPAAAPAFADPAPVLPSLEELGAPFSSDSALTSFEMTGFESSSANLDLDLPIIDAPPARPSKAPPAPDADPGALMGEDVHVTLDAFSLAPIEPTRPPSGPLDWDVDSPAGGPPAPAPDEPPRKKR